MTIRDGLLGVIAPIVMGLVIFGAKLYADVEVLKNNSVNAKALYEVITRFDTNIALNTQAIKKLEDTLRESGEE